MTSDVLQALFAVTEDSDNFNNDGTLNDQGRAFLDSVQQQAGQLKESRIRLRPKRRGAILLESCSDNSPTL